MRYWDSTALLSLVLQDEGSARLERLLDEDPAIVTWWGTQLECASALARLEADQGINSTGFREALASLSAAQSYWIEVPASGPVRDQTVRLLRVHQLRTDGALQLAAAVVASGQQPGSLEFVTLDPGQALAAEREGFGLAIA